MNIDELEATLPNGFHDAEIERFTMDYGSATAELGLRLWIDTSEIRPDDHGNKNPTMRRAIIFFSGFVYGIVDPPQVWFSRAESLSVDLDTRDSESKVKASAIPVGGFRFRLYVSDWCSGIEIVAREARLDWSEKDPLLGAPRL